MDHARVFWSQTLARSSTYQNNYCISSHPGLEKVKKQKVNKITPKWIMLMIGRGEADRGGLPTARPGSSCTSL